MAETLAAVQAAREPQKAAMGRPENVFERAEETFEAIARRAYEIFNRNGQTFGHELENWCQAESEFLHPMHMDVTETPEAFQVRAEVPGFSAKELELNVEANRLAISGKRATNKEEKRGKTILSETCSNQILRIVNLPGNVDPAKAEATVRNGILELRLPKAEKAAHNFRIEPTTAG